MLKHKKSGLSSYNWSVLIFWMYSVPDFLMWLSWTHILTFDVNFLFCFQNPRRNEVQAMLTFILDSASGFYLQVIM